MEQKKPLLSFQYTINKFRKIGYWKYIIKIEINDKLKEAEIKNRTSYYIDDIIKFEDFDIDSTLLDEKSYKYILVYGI